MPFTLCHAASRCYGDDDGHNVDTTTVRLSHRKARSRGVCHRRNGRIPSIDKK